MTDCNRCGRCCDPVVLPYTQDQIRRLLPGQLLEPENRDWVLNDLTPIRRRDGLRRTEYMHEGGKTTYSYANDGTVILFSFFYECRWFDKETRECTNYDNRPPICDGYPWYGEPPDPAKAIPEECSFRADVGQPVKFTRRRPA